MNTRPVFFLALGLAAGGAFAQATGTLPDPRPDAAWAEGTPTPPPRSAASQPQASGSANTPAPGSVDTSVSGAGAATLGFCGAGLVKKDYACVSPDEARQPAAPRRPARPR